MALVTESIVVTVTGANPKTYNYSVQVDTSTGAGVNPLSVPLVGTNAGTDTVVATMPSHSLTSNTAEIAWQAINGQIAVVPYTVTAYSNTGLVRGWPTLNGSVLGTTAGVNSLVFNEVVANYPINPFCEPNNVSSCGGGYKTNPMVAVQQTSSGTGSTPLTLAGTSTNNSSGNFPGFVLSAVTSLVVSTAGTYTFYVNYANVSSFAVYIGNGATFSSQNQGGGGGNNTGNGAVVFPTTGPKSGTPIAIVSTNVSAGSHPPVISSYITFPTPGIYTIEFVYNQFLSCQFSYDNNSYFQITYLAGAQSQSVGSQGPGIGSQSFPVTAATAPPSGATPSGDLRLTPTGGASGLKVQGTTDTLTLTVQNVPYTSIPYCPILEGTAGSLFVYNNGTSFAFQTYNGNAVDTTAAASNVFSVSGSNTSGIFSVTPSGSAFALNYNGGTFSFIVPGSQISTTDLTLTADDIAWYYATNKSFDLFTPVSGVGGISYAIAVDFMVKPTVKSVSPASLNGTGVAQAITINLSQPFSPQQQGLYGTGNTITAVASVGGGASISTLTPILSSSYLTGWSATVTPALSSTNGSIPLTLTVSGTLTYLSGTSFVTNTVTYISGVVATIPTVGDQYVPPVAVSLAVSPGGTPMATNETITGTVYTFDNNPLTMTFYQKSTTTGATGVAIGSGVLTNSYTGTVGGKTAYYKTFSLSHAFPTVSVTDVTQAEIYLGFVASDTVSGLTVTYYSTTVYTEPYTIIVITGCFSGNVGIKLPGGVFEQMALLPRDELFEIENETGIHLAKLIVHEDYDGEMIEFTQGKLVTLEHPMKAGKNWIDAEVKWADKPRENFHGTVYNLHVMTDNPEDQHYILDTGDVAHNKAEVCFSPNTLVETQRGEVKITEVIEGKDKVLTARGTWKTIEFVTVRKWNGPMLDMGDGELSTPTHYVKHEEAWKPMNEAGYGFPTVHYEGTIHNIHINCDADDDGTALDTEHSYTLANGLVVHNVTTVA